MSMHDPIWPFLEGTYCPPLVQIDNAIDEGFLVPTGTPISGADSSRCYKWDTIMGYLELFGGHPTGDRVPTRDLLDTWGKDRCDVAPVITGHTASDISAGDCPGGGWTVRSTIVVSGSVTGDYEIEKEFQLDGGAWTAWVQNQTLIQDATHFIGEFGTDQGFGEQKIVRYRARIRWNARTCGGWVESNEASRVLESCVL
jgi:hypothetical protein